MRANSSQYRYALFVSRVTGASSADARFPGDPPSRPLADVLPAAFLVRGRIYGAAQVCSSPAPAEGMLADVMKGRHSVASSRTRDGDCSRDGWQFEAASVRPSGRKRIKWPTIGTRTNIIPNKCFPVHPLFPLLQPLKIMEAYHSVAGRILLCLYRVCIL